MSDLLVILGLGVAGLVLLYCLICWALALLAVTSRSAHSSVYHDYRLVPWAPLFAAAFLWLTLGKDLVWRLRSVWYRLRIKERRW